MDLKARSNVTVVWYHDLEDFLEGIYGFRPDIQAGEYSNESYIEFEVKDFETDSDIDAEITQWKESANPYVDWELIGCDLARKKLLPEGHYLITIWW